MTVAGSPRKVAEIREVICATLAGMGDETRKLLKLFGVTVTDFEAEAEKLTARAAQLSPASGKEDILSTFTDMSELGRELTQRWLEVTQHVFAAHGRLLATLAEACARARGAAG